MVIPEKFTCGRVEKMDPEYFRNLLKFSVYYFYQNQSFSKKLFYSLAKLYNDEICELASRVNTRQNQLKKIAHDQEGKIFLEIMEKKQVLTRYRNFLDIINEEFKTFSESNKKVVTSN